MPMCLRYLHIQMKGPLRFRGDGGEAEQRVWIWYPLLVGGSHVPLHPLHPTHISPAGQLYHGGGAGAGQDTAPSRGLIGVAPFWWTWPKQLNSRPRPSVCHYQTSDKAVSPFSSYLRPHVSAYDREIKQILHVSAAFVWRGVNTGEKD